MFQSAFADLDHPGKKTKVFLWTFGWIISSSFRKSSIYNIMNPVAEFLAGPGSYNITNDLKKRSPIYHNSPRTLIGQGKKFPDVYISDHHIKEKMCIESPPPNAYNPNTDVLFTKNNSLSFGTSKRIDYFGTAKNRSPGPIYFLPKFESTGTSFGFVSKSAKHVYHNSLINSAKSEKKEVKRKSLENDSRKLFLSKFYTEKDNFPGPGAYGHIFYKDNQNSAKFNKAKRSIDIRVCIFYLDQKVGAYLSSFK